MAAPIESPTLPELRRPPLSLPRPKCLGLVTVILFIGCAPDKASDPSAHKQKGTPAAQEFVDSKAPRPFPVEKEIRSIEATFYGDQRTQFHFCTS
jgi:hypothetical protein